MDPPLWLHAIASVLRAVRSSVSAEPVKFNVSPCVIAPSHIKAAGKRCHLARAEFVRGHFWEGEIRPVKLWHGYSKKKNIYITVCCKPIKEKHHLQGNEDNLKHPSISLSWKIDKVHLDERVDNCTVILIVKHLTLLHVCHIGVQRRTQDGALTMSSKLKLLMCTSSNRRWCQVH